MDHYERIRHFLDHVERDYGAQICIKDFIGFISIDKKLDQTLGPYLGHRSPYCQFVKQELGHNRCLLMMRPLYDKCCRCIDGFGGMCNAGVSEYVVPIHIDGEVLGCINIAYEGEDPLSARRVLRRAFGYGDASALSRAEALFSESARLSGREAQDIFPALHLLSDSLSQSYMQLQSSHVTHLLPHTRRRSNAATVTHLAMEYIQLNYMNHIAAADIAVACYCSVSYINHVFTKTVGVNINTYINKVRIEHAKNALLLTTEKISTVALDVGFSDPNYFSKVFSDLLGISPSEFRRRYAT